MLTARHHPAAADRPTPAHQPVAAGAGARPETPRGGPRPAARIPPAASGPRPSGQAASQAASRLLVIPGLHDSGPEHWQTWLQQQLPGSVRVEQADWHTPDLDAWQARIHATLQRQGPGPWLAVAHSFGVLALVRQLALHGPGGIHGALLVAPADPRKFGVQAQLPAHRLPVPSGLLGSQTDPWMPVDEAARWARRWGSHFVNLGDAGHVNVASGHHTLPLAWRWVKAMHRRGG